MTPLSNMLTPASRHASSALTPSWLPSTPLPAVPQQPHVSQSPVMSQPQPAADSAPHLDMVASDKIGNGFWPQAGLRPRGLPGVGGTYRNPETGSHASSGGGHSDLPGSGAASEEEIVIANTSSSTANPLLKPSTTSHTPHPTPHPHYSKGTSPQHPPSTEHTHATRGSTGFNMATASSEHDVVFGMAPPMPVARVMSVDWSSLALSTNGESALEACDQHDGVSHASSDDTMPNAGDRHSDVLGIEDLRRRQGGVGIKTLSLGGYSPLSISEVDHDEGFASDHIERCASLDMHSASSHPEGRQSPSDVNSATSPSGPGSTGPLPSHASSVCSPPHDQISSSGITCNHLDAHPAPTCASSQVPPRPLSSPPALSQTATTLTGGTHPLLRSGVSMRLGCSCHWLQVLVACT